LHVGVNSRYRRPLTPPTPPAFELVSGSTISKFNGTTNQSPSSQNDPVQPERSHYFDPGIAQKIGSALTLGLDAYYKKSTNGRDGALHDSRRWFRRRRAGESDDVAAPEPVAARSATSLALLSSVARRTARRKYAGNTCAFQRQLMS
jgi:hypothetical protein